MPVNDCLPGLLCVNSIRIVVIGSQIGHAPQRSLALMCAAHAWPSHLALALNLLHMQRGQTPMSSRPSSHACLLHCPTICRCYESYRAAQ